MSEILIKDVEQKMINSINHLIDEFSTIRTGRANPSMLEGITIDYYGTETPLNQCCSITVEDSKTLSLTPWDKSLVQEIDKSIQKSDRGEYEITSLIEKYLENNALNFQFTNGWWVDAGTPEAIQTIEKLI